MKTAMILAAGRGARLRPLTDYQPKALCTLSKKTLLGHHLCNLAEAGYQKIIINHAYLGGQIRQFVRQAEYFGLDIHWSPEPPGGLETGGGIVNALDLLGREPFITLNGDIYTDYDLKKLHMPAESLAHVVLVSTPNYRTQGDYGLSAQGLLTNHPQNYVFSGITVYKADFFAKSRRGRFSVTPLMRAWVQQQRISGEYYNGLWFDIGTPEQLLDARRALGDIRN